MINLLKKKMQQWSCSIESLPIVTILAGINRKYKQALFMTANEYHRNDDNGNAEIIKGEFF